MKQARYDLIFAGIIGCYLTYCTIASLTINKDPQTIKPLSYYVKKKLSQSTSKEISAQIRLTAFSHKPERSFGAPLDEMIEIGSSGDLHTIISIAKFYQHYAQGIDDIDIAIRCTTQAAATNNSEAMVLLAQLYEQRNNMTDIPKYNQKDIENLLTAALNLGNSNAPLYRAKRYYAQKQLQNAHEQFKLALVLGNSEALLYFARQDPHKERALRFYQEAARLKNEDALLYLAQQAFNHNKTEHGLQLYEQLAYKGNTKALHNLIEIYSLMNPPHLTRARYWIQQGKTQNDITCLKLLAYQHYSHIGTTDHRNFKEAARLYDAAAMQGDQWSLVMLGNIYRIGCKNMLPNANHALYWYHKASESMDPDTRSEALLCLGIMHYTGRLIKQDYHKASAIFKGITLGYPNTFCSFIAQAYLGNMYVYGKGVKQDEGKGFKMIELAQCSPTTFRNVSKLTKLYLMKEVITNENNTKKENKQEYTIKPDDTHEHVAHLYYFMAICYRDGLGVESSEYQYRKFLEKSSMAYLGIADYELAQAYNNRSISLSAGEQYDQKAFHHYHKSALFGYNKGMYAVASFYEEGKGGVEKNSNKALQWYELAASYHHIEATEKLLDYYITIGNQPLKVNELKNKLEQLKILFQTF